MVTVSLPLSETLEINSSSLFLECFTRSSDLRPSQNNSPQPLSFKLLSEGSPLPPFPPNFPKSKRIPGTRFVVDGFRCSGAFSLVYFLSHFHSDHYSGLSPNWSRGLVFCSPVTARLCVACLNVLECFVVPVELGCSVRIDGCKVTFVDANHCPGAVQILIKVCESGGREKRYVHTGDMRFSESMLNDRFLNEFVGADAVFLDTTYCNPRFVFPSQDYSIEYIVKAIERIRGSRAVKGESDGVGERESVLFLISTYVIGKEKILLEISRRIGCPVFVDAMKMVILDELGLAGNGAFTVESSASDVHVVSWNELGETWPYFRPNFVNMKKILDERKYYRAVGFVPTGWVFSANRDDFIVRVKDSCEIHLVPYSEHSSYDELKKYVRFLRPKSVVPTVGMENGKKSSTAYRRDICKHFSGLMDEMANKLGFLEAFNLKASDRHEPRMSGMGFINENVVAVGSEEDGELYTQNPSENQEAELESAECKLQLHALLENDDKLPLLNSHSSAGLKVSEKIAACSTSEVRVVVSDSVITDTYAETSTQELRDCLPEWVTVSQVVKLLGEASGDITEAVSIFYECERELHEQVISQRKTSSRQIVDANSIGGRLENLASNSGSPPILASMETEAQITSMFSMGSLSQPKNSLVPNLTSPRKRKTLGTDKSKKIARPSAMNFKSDKYKQVTITKFFGKAQNSVPEDVCMNDEVIHERVKDELLYDAATKDEGKVSQLLHILDSNVTVDHAVILLEKAKGDVNLALDFFYNESTCSVEDVDGRVGSCSTLDKFHMIPSDTVRLKESICPEKVIHMPSFGGKGNKEPGVSTNFVSLPSETYLPVEHACWSTGQLAPYLHLANTFELVEHERSRLKVTSMLCNMFRSLLALSPEDVLPSVYLCTNRIAPDYQNVELNVGSSLIASAIEEACGTSRSRIRELYNTLGDLGDVALACRQTQSLLAPPRPVYIRELFSLLQQMSTEAGGGSITRKKSLIVNLMRSCREKEMKFLVRTLVRNMRIGAMMRTVLPALAHAVVMHSLPSSSPELLRIQLQSLSAALVEAYNVLPNLDILFPSLIGKGIQFSASTVSMIPGIPIRPMLAKVTNGVSQALKWFQGRAFSCEYKYDGQRAQVHKLMDGSIKIFSRNGEETTSRFPDLVKIINESSKHTAETFILDGEVVAIDRKNGNKIMPFQQLCSRERGGRDSSVKIDNIKVDICIFVFDIMFANGEQLLGFPLRERRCYLKHLFRDAKVGCFEFVQEITVESDEACVESQETLAKINSFLKDAFRYSCEGIIVKSLDIDAEYVASKRTDTWLKVKKDYIDGLGDSFDLVPIGAWHGNGRKAGWYSPFLMACYDADSEEFQSVCRVMSGFSDSFYVKMKDFFSDEKILSKKPPYYHTLEVPDIWFSAELVWEIRGADLTVSPVHQAAVGLAHPSRGISIRFPRYIRTVVDKKPEDCSTASDIANAFCSQTRKLEVDVNE